MPQIQDQWGSLLIPGIMHFHDLGQKDVPQIRERLFGPAIPSTLSEENGTGLGSMGNEAWDEFQRAGQVGELDLCQPLEVHR